MRRAQKKGSGGNRKGGGKRGGPVKPVVVEESTTPSNEGTPDVVAIAKDMAGEDAPVVEESGSSEVETESGGEVVTESGDGEVVTKGDGEVVTESGSSEVETEGDTSGRYLRRSSCRRRSIRACTSRVSRSP